jgi:hypothetical protein
MARKPTGSTVMKRQLLWLAAAGTVFLHAADLRAQTPWPVSVEANLGATRGLSSNDGAYRGGRSGVMADALVGARLHGPETGGAFVAVNGTMHLVNYIRTTDCPLRPDGSCVPWFPEIGVVSLLGGWESKSTNVRVLGGAGVASSDFRKVLGIVSRVDLGLPFLRRTSLVASLNTLVVPSLDGDTFFFFAAGAGIRVR